MTEGAEPGGSRPLRPGDPRRMGRYELIGRLGEGGMGTVYLASTPEGRQVAVKIIKTDLVDDPQFRQRFRTEVERAQDVPPFCTAEVLDADPDHDQPYLVVEYVAGPSLSTVVAQQGPLTSANLHGLAIGVATALTAIHGAGVIHRDLKPSNVLLAPGSPKVIDFGIARAVEGAVSHTRTDQMVGTVTYMAPERFDSGNGRILSPAADIFAWGAVIAYAGTGRTPFAADLPHMVAVRILTMPPDLEGLTGPLRGLVEQALSKDPADRPTARELLDRLLSAGPLRPGGASAVLDRQPALRSAVDEARAVDDGHTRERAAGLLPGGTTTRFDLQGRVSASPSSSPSSPSSPSPSPSSSSSSPSSPSPSSSLSPSPSSSFPPSSSSSFSPVTGAAGRPGANGMPGGSGASGNEPTVAWAVAPQLAGPAAGVVAAPPRRGSGRVVTGVLAFVAVIAVVLLGGIVYGLIPLHRGGGSPTTGAGASAPASAAATSPNASSGAAVTVISDPLTSERDWRTVLDPANKAACEFDDALVVRKESSGPYRCPGPRRLLSDFTVTVTTRLLTEDACAAVWLRFDKIGATAAREAGYVLAICTDGYKLMTHGVDGVSNMAELTSFPFDQPAPLRQAIAVGITAKGSKLTFTRDGAELGSWKDSQFASGRMVFGVLNMSANRAAKVSFNDVEIRA